MKAKVLQHLAVVMLLSNNVNARRLNKHHHTHYPQMFIGIQDNGIVGSDDIANSSNSDMFAFSQVIANGGGVGNAIAELTKSAE